MSQFVITLLLASGIALGVVAVCVLHPDDPPPSARARTPTDTSQATARLMPWECRSLLRTLWPPVRLCSLKRSINGGLGSRLLLWAPTCASLGHWVTAPRRCG